MPERVETTDPDGVDHTWVMQVTFVLALAVGAPVVAVLSADATLPTWTDKAVFAVRVGAVVWLVIAGAVYAYARRRGEEDDETGAEEAEDGDGEADSDPAAAGR